MIMIMIMIIIIIVIVVTFWKEPFACVNRHLKEHLMFAFLASFRAKFRPVNCIISIKAGPMPSHHVTKHGLSMSYLPLQTLSCQLTHLEESHGVNYHIFKNDVMARILKRRHCHVRPTTTTSDEYQAMYRSSQANLHTVKLSIMANHGR